MISIDDLPILYIDLSIDFEALSSAAMIKFNWTVISYFDGIPY